MNRRAALFLAISLLSSLLVFVGPPGSAELAGTAGEGGSVFWPAEKRASAEPEDERTPGEAPGNERTPWPERWREATGWRNVDGRFSTDAAEPLVLHRFDRMEDGFLYFFANHLFHEYAADGEPGGWKREAVITFHRSMEGQGWNIGGKWLVGFDPGESGQDAGLWYWFDWSRFAGPPHYPELIRHAPFHPGDPLRLTAAEDPPLILATVDRGERVDDYALLPGEGWRAIGTTYREGAAGGETGGGQSDRRTEQGPEPDRFSAIKRFVFPELGTLYALEDERGTLLYLDREEWDPIWRFAGYRALDFRLVPSLFGEPKLLGEWLAPGGERVIAMPDSRFSIDDRLSPALWDDHWLMAGDNGFVRVGGEALEWIRYRETYGDDGRLLHHEAGAYPLGDASFAGRDGMDLVFDQGGVRKRISARDVLLYRPVGRAASLDELWRETVPHALRPVAGVPAVSDYAKFRFPAAADREPPVLPQDLPDQLATALEANCYSGCGDYTTRLVIRQAAGDWYVLAEQTLSRFDGERLLPVAEWPVTVSRTAYYEKGGESDTARDFAKSGEGWVVADTYGHRVLWMDADFQVREAVSVPFPMEVKEEGDGYAVVHLNGTTRLDRAFTVIGESPPAAAPFDAWTERLVHEPSVHVDAATGWTWLAMPDGWLVRFNGDGEWERRWIGRPYNGHTQPVLLVHGGDVLALLDEYAIRFAADGSWVATYEYPRTLPPYVYIYPYSGEMTWQLDDQRETVYLVRGEEIVALDLAKGEPRILFRQEQSTIGPLALADDRLFFTLHSGSLDHPETLENQLIVYDLAAGRFTRYALEPGVLTHAADDRGIIMAMPQPGDASDLDYFVLDMDF